MQVSTCFGTERRASKSWACQGFYHGNFSVLWTFLHWLRMYTFMTYHFCTYLKVAFLHFWAVNKGIVLCWNIYVWGQASLPGHFDVYSSTDYFQHGSIMVRSWVWVPFGSCYTIGSDAWVPIVWAIICLSDTPTGQRWLGRLPNGSCDCTCSLGQNTS